MRLGLVSDVHCSVDALERAVSAMSGQVEEILLAGDAMYEYRFSNEVVEVVRRQGIRYVLGNHEQVLLGPHGVRARSAATVRQDNLRFVQSTPTSLSVNVGGKRLLMMHGSPWAPHSQYLLPSSPLLSKADELEVDFLVLGHTHVPMAERPGRTLVINPGSLQRSREQGQDDTVTYAILDTVDESVELFRMPIAPPGQSATSV